MYALCTVNDPSYRDVRNGLAKTILLRGNGGFLMRKMETRAAPCDDEKFRVPLLTLPPRIGHILIAKLNSRNATFDQCPKLRAP